MLGVREGDNARNYAGADRIAQRLEDTRGAHARLACHAHIPDVDGAVSPPGVDLTTVCAPARLCVSALSSAPITVHGSMRFD